MHNVEAICVPGIDINLNLPGLGKIVKGFRNSGYKLLDEFLDEDREDISNIQFILGANSAHYVMERMVVLVIVVSLYTMKLNLALY